MSIQFNLRVHTELVCSIDNTPTDDSTTEVQLNTVVQFSHFVVSFF